MLHRSSWLVALSLCLGALACGDDPPDDELVCPAGTVRSGGQCVAPGTDAAQNDAAQNDASGDAGTLDTGTAEDTGNPGDTGGSEDGGIPDGGEGQAAISRTAIDFGRTVVGTEWIETVEITNRSSATVRVRIGILSGAQAGDYSVVASSTVGPNGVDLESGQGLTLTFTFEPRAVGARGASMIVSLCDGGCDETITLSGEGILDAIECAPLLLDFGLVNPGACSAEPVSCNNVSSHGTTISDVGFSAGSAPTFSVTSTQAPLAVAAGANQPSTLSYRPTAVGRQTATFEVEVVHPDPARRTKAIALSGVGGGPNIVCAPGNVDFGIAAIGQSRTVGVVCSNDGDAPLSITGAAVNPASTVFTAVASGLPAVFAPGVSITIDVTFSSPVAGIEMGALEITSDDQDTPVVLIPLIGEALAANGCTLELQPAAIDFGAVRTGRSAQATTRVVNTGTGACGVNVLGLAPGSDPVFSVLATAPGQLQPGAALSIDVTFTASLVQLYQGAIALSTTDLANPSPTIALNGEGVGPGFALSTNPTALDFGTIAPACADAATRLLSVRNLGATPLQVTVTPDPQTPSAFTVDGATSSTFNLLAGQATDVRVGFLPTAAGAYAGRLEIAAPGLSSIFVALTGDSSATAANVETFGGGGVAQVIDLLLIVDDSCSMSEEQARLAAAAPTLIARGDVAGVDYHIGVTTTDPGLDPFSPIPGGTLRGTPTYVTSLSPSREVDLAAAINQGVNGSGDERGLYTMTQAVTSATLLSGTNQGFLRANGELAILVISDEEDFSPDPVANYIAALNNRPVGLPDSVRIFGITSTELGCTDGGGFPNTPELRYTEAAGLSGGFIRPICDADYTPILIELADAIFQGSRATYQLGSRPAPGSVEVRIDGVLTPPGTGASTVWGIDYARAQVTFLPGQAPSGGATIEIRYNSVCTPATCGNATPQAGEQCDDGNAVNTDACIDNCYSASCGDGFTRATIEQCDDGNTLPGDGCNAACVIEGCGNGAVEPGEQCDNGAANSDTVPNACRTDCRTAYCRDGVIDTGETCDDGNLLDNDACPSSCQTARCGDGFVRTGTEQCDDGNLVNNDLCTNACVFNLPSFTVTSAAAVLTPTAGGTAMALADENEVQVPVGFAFSFYGAAVTTIAVASNGAIAFDQPAASFPFTNAAIPTAAAPNGFIAWWWDDLDFGRAGFTASATEQILGTAPNRIHVLTFQNVPKYQTGNTVITAEVRLFETTNVITVHYGTATGAGTTFDASVGWEEPMGIAGQDVLGCGATCGTVNWPTNTRYTYTP